MAPKQKTLRLLPGYFKVTPLQEGFEILVKYSKGTFKKVKGLFKLKAFENGYYIFERK